MTIFLNDILDTCLPCSFFLGDLGNRAFRAKGEMNMRTLINANLVFLPLIFLVFTSASAQLVYKCKSPSGGIEFSDSPCQNGKIGDRIAVQPNSLDSSGGREYLLKKENDLLKEQIKTLQNSNQSRDNGPTPRTPSDLHSQRIDTIACEKAKRDYEVTASSTSNNRELVEAKRSVMYGACGMREPDKVDVRIDNKVNVDNKINIRR